MDCSPPGSSVPGDSPGKNTGMDCHALLQGIFPTQGLNPGLSHWRMILYHLSHWGSPRILELFLTQRELPDVGIKLGSSALHMDFFLPAELPGKVKIKSESEVAQLCPTLCDPKDCSLSGFSVHGIFQARVLEWVVISFSRDLPDPGIKPGSPALQADAFTLWATREAHRLH